MINLKKLFNKSIKPTIAKHFDVAIVGCWNIKNYGSTLTYYALYSVLKNLGYSTGMIGCPQDSPYKTSVDLELFNDNPYDKNDIIDRFKNKDEMFFANYYADTFVVGSDQVWNNELYKYFGCFTLLDYIFDSRKKFSYATSFGYDEWHGNMIEKDLFSFYLNRFDAISVRERSGVDICKNCFSVDATWCIDPVFLCDNHLYEEISSKSTIKFPKKYMAAYILDYSPECEEAIKLLSNNLGLDYILVTDPNISKQKWKIDAHMDYSVEDWLSFIKNCDFVLTDSFHGTCFSIIFNKDFLSIVNKRRGAARFYDYANILGFNDRLLDNISLLDINQMLFDPIEYTRVNSLVEHYSFEGLKWIKEKMSISKNYNTLSRHDIDEIEKKYNTFR